MTKIYKVEEQHYLEPWICRQRFLFGLPFLCIVLHIFLIYFRFRFHQEIKLYRLSRKPLGMLYKIVPWSRQTYHLQRSGCIYALRQYNFTVKKLCTKQIYNFVRVLMMAADC